MGKSKGKSDILQIVGNNIRTIRLSKNLTQEQMAEKLGRSTNFVSLIELGKSGVSIETIIDICNILDINSESVFKGLLDYEIKDKDKFIIETISTLSNEDKEVVKNLLEYIVSKNSK